MPKHASRIGCRGTCTSGPERSSTSTSPTHAGRWSTPNASARRRRPGRRRSPRSPRSMTPAVPSSSGCTTASSGYASSRPCRSTASGANAGDPAHERVDGRADVVPVARQRQPLRCSRRPPIFSAASSSSTEQPRSRRSAAAVSPFGPAPTTTTSYSGTGRGACGSEAVTAASRCVAEGALPPSLAYRAEKSTAGGLSTGRTRSGPDPPGARQAPGRAGRRPAPGHGPMGLRPSSSPNPPLAAEPALVSVQPRNSPPTSGDRASIPGDQFGSPLPRRQRMHNRAQTRDEVTESTGSFTDDHLHTGKPQSEVAAPILQARPLAAWRVSSSRSAPGARRLALRRQR